ncbi:MAG: hypothetical protein U1D31_01005 [Patescibacteria group bacterium]|nr:hypothetical protein [bacterium]MDZ4240699.1 hypothetical protein [Patescibacteria group bacterium]
MMKLYHYVHPIFLKRKDQSRAIGLVCELRYPQIILGEKPALVSTGFIQCSRCRANSILNYP